MPSSTDDYSFYRSGDGSGHDNSQDNQEGYYQGPEAVAEAFFCKRASTVQLFLGSGFPSHTCTADMLHHTVRCVLLP